MRTGIFDHTGGNEWMHESGASIPEHENTRTHLSTDTRVEGNWQLTFLAAPAGAIPSTVFKEEHKVYANDTTLVMKHYRPAHSDSDTSVHFTEMRDKISALKKQVISLAEVVAAKPGARTDDECGKPQGPADFVALVYQAYEKPAPGICLRKSGSVFS
jgi:hypothetical protein